MIKKIDYDGISKVYDVSRGINTGVLEDLCKILKVTSKSYLIDLGCGTGNFAIALQQFSKRIIGIDLSRSMVRETQSKSPNLQVLHGDVSFLPFNSETFDGAYSIQVLHHIKEKEQFLREIYRILRNNAKVTINSCSHKQHEAFWVLHYFPRGLEVDLERIPDVKEIESMLKKAGFSNVSSKICRSDAILIDQKPENYLNKQYRDGLSTFALLTEEEIETGCNKIREDIASGKVYEILREYNEKWTDFGGSTFIFGKKK
ncbi:MAG: class I SAM-dependent methyltransferase [Candidatus Lokiarchaeota archaeon]|nr:class I SAM-dependent methyltransferase [Candidatus Lokiarchaeota archaeon]